MVRIVSIVIAVQGVSVQKVSRNLRVVVEWVRSASWSRL